MFQPLEDATFDFADARDAFVAAQQRDDPRAGLEALLGALKAAEIALVILGYVNPYECGECEACKANASARRADMEAAVEADPDLSTAIHGPVLSEADEAAARRLLAVAFGDDPEGGEDE